MDANRRHLASEGHNDCNKMQFLSARELGLSARCLLALMCPAGDANRATWSVHDTPGKAIRLTASEREEGLVGYILGDCVMSQNRHPCPETSQPPGDCCESLREHMFDFVTSWGHEEVRGVRRCQPWVRSV
jgi:hypothetical protein